MEKLNTMSILDKASAIADRLTEIRSDFHSHPELSFNEERTAKKVEEILKELALDDVQTGVAGTGVVALLRGGSPGRTIALRADMDALPIQEENNVPYKSQNDGVMHACGHDVHVTALLGAAMVLSRMREQLRGNVKFIFQPAEEVAGGGKAMVDAGALSSPPAAEAAVALHVWPGLEEGKIGVKAGPFMANMDKFEIVLRGPGGHGAMPHLTSDPVATAAQVICALQTIVSRSVSPIQPAVLSVCMIQGGHAFDIIPEEVKMVGTVRTLDDQVKADVVKRAEEIVKGIAGTMDIDSVFTYLDGCPSLGNDPHIVEIIKKAGSALLGSENVLEMEPTMGGEDFTYFARAVPGALFCLGVTNESKGLTGSIHTSTFDVSPRSFVLGAALLSQVALTYLNE